MLCFTKNIFGFPCQQFQGDFYKFILLSCRYYTHQEGFFLCVWSYVQCECLSHWLLVISYYNQSLALVIILQEQGWPNVAYYSVTGK